jgi:hypothetical protein
MEQINVGLIVSVGAKFPIDNKINSANVMT